MHRRKRTATLVLDESIFELSRSYAQINEIITTVTSCCQIKKIVSYLLLSSRSVTRSHQLFVLLYFNYFRPAMNRLTQANRFNLSHWMSRVLQWRESTHGPPPQPMSRFLEAHWRSPYSYGGNHWVLIQWSIPKEAILLLDHSDPCNSIWISSISLF